MNVTSYISTDPVILSTPQELAAFITAAKSSCKKNIGELQKHPGFENLAKIVSDAKNVLPLMLEAISICEGILSGEIKGQKESANSSVLEVIDLWGRAESCKATLASLCENWSKTNASGEIQERWESLKRMVSTVLSGTIKEWALPRGPEWVHPLALLYVGLKN